MLASQNLIDSHDVDRLASQIVNPDGYYDHDANGIHNPQYDVRAPRGLEKDRLRLLVALQMLLPGAPMIYYGDEAGMWGGDDPSPRKPMVWPELEYDDEAAHPLLRERSADPVEFDHDLFAYYQYWIKFRRDNPVVAEGNMRLELISTHPKLLKLIYAVEAGHLEIVANNSPEPATYAGTVEGDSIALPAYGIKVFQTSSR